MSGDRVQVIDQFAFVPLLHRSKARPSVHAAYTLCPSVLSTCFERALGAEGAGRLGNEKSLIEVQGSGTTQREGRK